MSNNNSKTNVPVKTPSSSGNVVSKTQLPPTFIPSQFDVICGRGKLVFNNVANQRLRQKVEMNLARYWEEPSKIGKTLIITQVVDEMRTFHPVRRSLFVRRDASSRSWYEIGDEGARVKVGNLFREIREAKKRKKRRMEALFGQSEKSEDSDDDETGMACGATASNAAMAPGSTLHFGSAVTPSTVRLDYPSTGNIFGATLPMASSLARHILPSTQQTTPSTTSFATRPGANVAALLQSSRLSSQPLLTQQGQTGNRRNLPLTHQIPEPSSLALPFIGNNNPNVAALTSHPLISTIPERTIPDTSISPSVLETLAQSYAAQSYSALLSPTVAASISSPQNQLLSFNPHIAALTVVPEQQILQDAMMRQLMYSQRQEENDNDDDG